MARGNLFQHNKNYTWETHNQQHPKWRKSWKNYIKLGMRQRWLLSPFLFNIVIEKTSWRNKTRKGNERDTNRERGEMIHICLCHDAIYQRCNYSFSPKFQKSFQKNEVLPKQHDKVLHGSNPLSDRTSLLVTFPLLW